MQRPALVVQLDTVTKRRSLGQVSAAIEPTSHIVARKPHLERTAVLSQEREGDFAFEAVKRRIALRVSEHRQAVLLETGVCRKDEIAEVVVERAERPMDA